MMMYSRISSNISIANGIEDDDNAALFVDNLLTTTLDEFDFIAPRSPLKAIMSSLGTKEWKILASRPLDTGPIFLDRCIGYPVNMGTVGRLFEHSMTDTSTSTSNSTSTSSSSCCSYGAYVVCEGVLSTGIEGQREGDINKYSTAW
jgi:hypothetical protein